jgi:hypothetical protein
VAWAQTTPQAAVLREVDAMDVDAVVTVLQQVEKEMKGLGFIADAAERRINSSFAVFALQAYMCGDVDKAQADFQTLAAELNARRQFTAKEERDASDQRAH